MLSDEMRQLTDEELLDVYEDGKAELSRLRQLYTTGELVDTTQFRKTKRQIARALTILRQRELAAEIAEEEVADAQ